MTERAEQHRDTPGAFHQAPSDDEVRSGLERILLDPTFEASARRRDILRYIVTEKLAGRGQRLKGVSIAQDVLGRGDDFDQQTDPVVRIEARRLRRDLDSYYANAGATERLRIEIPKGAYIPYFSWLEQAGMGSPPSPERETATVGNDDNLAADESIIASEPLPPSETAARHPWFLRRGPTIAAAVCACVALIGAFFWLDGRTKTAEVAEANRGEPPGIIVVPFSALGESEDHKYLAAGISQELVTSLAAFPGFRLFWNPVGSSNGVDEDPISLGQKFGIKYVIDGTLQLTDDRKHVRLGARLTSAESGLVVWSAAFEHALAAGSLIKAQTDLASEVAAKIGAPYGIVTEDIRTRLLGKTVPSDTAYACVMKAYAYRRTFKQALYAPVLSCLQRAVVTDPGYAEAWAMLAWLRNDGARFGYAPDVSKPQMYAAGLEAAQQALALDPENVLAVKAISSIHHYRGDFEEGEAYARRALALNPNDPDTMAQLGWRLAVRGNFDEGIDYLNRAISQTVRPPPWYYALIVVDDYLDGRDAEMVEHAQVFASGQSAIAYSLLAIALAQRGDADGARVALAQMAEVDPRLAADPGAIYRENGTTDAIADVLVSGLKKAGWSAP